MIAKCKTPYCFAPETSCANGETQLQDCGAWRASVESSPELGSGPTDAAILVPWSGNSLGSADRSFVAARSSPKVIAVVGPSGAGKTTLLAAWYLLIGRGAGLDGRSFSGSYTLTGWENIAQALRWNTGGNGPSFPPHTSSGSGRVPGLLHMAFRERTSKMVDDLFFVDAPGEWFRLWAVNSEDPEAEGARWISEHADAFVVIADSDGLAGPDRGAARNILLQLLQRIGHELRGRPVAMVWSKSDVEVSPAIREVVLQSAKLHLGSPAGFSLSVKPRVEGGEITTEFMELLAWSVQARSDSVAIVRPPTLGGDAFMAYGHGPG
jgi:Double-GTPase 2